MLLKCNSLKLVPLAVKRPRPRSLAGAMRGANPQAVNGEGPLKKPPLPLHHCKPGAGSFCPELSGVGAGKNEVKIDFSLQPE